MGTRSSTLAVRLVILISIWLLGTATFSLAQDGGTTTSPVQGDEVVVNGEPVQATEETAEAATETGPLVVPDVLQLPYVFAKGILEDAGFAWKVKGKVEGYAVNIVVEQSVAPETHVLDTGAPTIILRLAANPAYPERGIPDNDSPYKGTPLELEDGSEPVPASAEVPASEATEKSDGDASTEEDASTNDATGAASTAPSSSYPTTNE